MRQRLASAARGFLFAEAEEVLPAVARGRQQLWLEHPAAGSWPVIHWH